MGYKNIYIESFRYFRVFAILILTKADNVDETTEKNNKTTPKQSSLEAKSIETSHNLITGCQDLNEARKIHPLPGELHFRENMNKLVLLRGTIP